MNKKITSIISVAMVFTAMINLTAQEDKYVKLANKVSISADSDAWLKVELTSDANLAVGRKLGFSYLSQDKDAALFVYYSASGSG